MEDVTTPVGFEHFADYHLTRAVSRHELRYTHFRSYLEHHMDAMVIELKKEVFGRCLEVEERSCVSVPASGWQHLKQDYFPRWFKRRWPVKMKAIPVKIVKKFVDRI